MFTEDGGRAAVGECREEEDTGARRYAMVVVVECGEPGEGWYHVTNALTEAGDEDGVSAVFVGEPMAAPEAGEYRSGRVCLVADETPVELRGEWS